MPRFTSGSHSTIPVRVFSDGCEMRDASLCGGGEWKGSAAGDFKTTTDRTIVGERRNGAAPVSRSLRQTSERRSPPRERTTEGSIDCSTTPLLKESHNTRSRRFCMDLCPWLTAKNVWGAALGAVIAPSPASLFDPSDLYRSGHRARVYTNRYIRINSKGPGR